MSFSDAETCDVCGRRAIVGVFAVQFLPLSLGHCQTCLDNNAFPERWINWVLGRAPGDSERRRYFEAISQVPAGDDYRRLASEQLNAMEAQGRRAWEGLRAQVEEARQSGS